MLATRAKEHLLVHISQQGWSVHFPKIEPHIVDRLDGLRDTRNFLPEAAKSTYPGKFQENLTNGMQDM